jgi:hypothetical protein
MNCATAQLGRRRWLLLLQGACQQGLCTDVQDLMMDALVQDDVLGGQLPDDDPTLAYMCAWPLLNEGIPAPVPLDIACPSTHWSSAVVMHSNGWLGRGFMPADVNPNTFRALVLASVMWRTSWSSVFKASDGTDEPFVECLEELRTLRSFLVTESPTSYSSTTFASMHVAFASHRKLSF